MAGELRSGLERHISIVKSTWSKEVSDLKQAWSLITSLRPVHGVLHADGSPGKNGADGLKAHCEVVRGRVG